MTSVQARIQRQALRVAKLRGRSRHEHALILADMVEEAGWPKNPNRIPTGRRGKPDVWEVRRQEAWGNPIDGWDVNNSFRVGELRVPTEEMLYNVISYRNAITRNLPPGRLGHPLIRMLHSTPVASDEAFWKAFKRAYLNPSVKRSQVDIEEPGDFIEISDAKTGEPLYYLEHPWTP